MKRYLIRLIQRLLIVTVAAAFAAAGEGTPVTLNFRDSAVVNDTMICLRDIARLSPAQGERAGSLLSSVVGESAPPGYSRYVNIADLVRYRLQPQFRDVAFTVNGHGRISVRTAGVSRKIGDYEGRILDSIAGKISWNSGEWKCQILNPKDSWNCFDVPEEISVSGLTGPKPKGKLQLQLIARQFGRVQRIPLSCRFSVVAPVVVAKSDLARGGVIGNADVALSSVDITEFAPAPFFDINAVIGKKASRTIAAGSIIHDRMVMTVPEIAKGDPVCIELSKGNVRVSVAAIARENGYRGRKMWVENASNHRLVRVVVKDKNTVTIL